MPRSAAAQHSDHPGSEGSVSIQSVSRTLGVPAATIRSWERRYAVPGAGRSLGGHRRYTPEDVSMLTRMRDEIANGRRAIAAATIAKQAKPTRRDVVSAILAAAHRIDGSAVLDLLRQSRETFGLEETIDDVLLPSMREIGEQWAAGLCDVAQEHAATAAAQEWLTSIRQAGPTLATGPLVLGCGPRDLHTLGLECLAALLTGRGIDCRMLGARTPVESLTLAVREADAVGAVVVSSLPAARRSAVAAIAAVAESGRPVYYGGAAFRSPRARVGVPGVYLGESLAEAARLVAAGLAAAP